MPPYFSPEGSNQRQPLSAPLLLGSPAPQSLGTLAAASGESHFGGDTGLTGTLGWLAGSGALSGAAGGAGGGVGGLGG